MEADEAEIIFLNDFRWSPNVIARADLLQALEVDVVLLPARKNSYKRDLELLTDTPFLAMSDVLLVLIRDGCIDRANTDIMNVCWRFFHFFQAETAGLSSLNESLFSLLCQIYY